MDNPREQIGDVIRSVTEPYDWRVILENVDKYFTVDAYIRYPLFNQWKSPDGRKNLRGVYRMLRVFTIDNKIDIHHVMFDQGMTHGTVEFTQNMQLRWLPFKRFALHIRYLVRLDLNKGRDKKYRIYRQEDNFPTDLTASGVPVFPGARLLNNACKTIAAMGSCYMGRFLIYMGSK